MNSCRYILVLSMLIGMSVYAGHEKKKQVVDLGRRHIGKESSSTNYTDSSSYDGSSSDDIEYPKFKSKKPKKKKNPLKLSAHDLRAYVKANDRQDGKRVPSQEDLKLAHRVSKAFKDSFMEVDESVFKDYIREERIYSQDDLKVLPAALETLKEKDEAAFLRLCVGVARVWTHNNTPKRTRKNKRVTQQSATIESFLEGIQPESDNSEMSKVTLDDTLKLLLLQQMKEMHAEQAKAKGEETEVQRSKKHTERRRFYITSVLAALELIGGIAAVWATIGSGCDCPGSSGGATNSTMV